MIPTTKVFVGGPIQHALSRAGFDNPLRGLIGSVHGALERAGFDVFSAHRAEKWGDITADLTSDQIARRDLDWMQRCDAFVACLPVGPDGLPFRSDGTHIELGWASALGKPVVLCIADPLPEGASHLVRGLSSIAAVEVVCALAALAEPHAVVGAVGRVLAASDDGRVRAASGGR